MVFCRTPVFVLYLLASVDVVFPLGTKFSLQSIRMELETVSALPGDGPLIGHDSVTFVFGRAVLALGSNFIDTNDTLGKVGDTVPILWRCEGQVNFQSEPPVEGLVRWVTTSIVRFDANGLWPNDLLCDVRVNPDLQAYDGSALVPSDTDQFHFTTSSLTMSLMSISSTAALDATDGLWDGFSGTAIPECPPDALVTLSFSHDVDPALVVPALRLFSDTSLNYRPVIAATASLAGTQVIITLPRLDVGEVYRLVLPVGTRVSPNSGLTKAELSISLNGLLPFTFPGNQYSSISHSNIALWVRHGLPSTADLVKLRGAISINPDIPGWTLRMASAADLRIHGSFQPGVSYTISTSDEPSIVDGFGLPLRRGSFTVSALDISPFVAYPNAFTLASPLSDSEPTGFFAISRGHLSTGNYPSYPPPCEATKLRMRNVGAQESSIIEALEVLNYHCSTDDSIANQFFDEAGYFSIIRGPQPPNTVIQDWDFPIAQSFNTSGWAVFMAKPVKGDWQSSCQSYQYATCQSYSQSTLGVVVSTDSTGSIVVWVTSLTDGSPVEGASVTEFVIPPQQWLNGVFSHRPVFVGSRGTTDFDGLAILTSTASNPSDTNRMLIVNYQGSLAMAPFNPVQQPGAGLTRGDLLLERKLFRVGESLNIKGFLARFDDQGLRTSKKQAADEGFRVTIVWSTDSKSTVDVTIDSRFDSFNLTVDVPADADYGAHTATLENQANLGNQWMAVAQTSFVIADPRIPTGFLECTTPATIFAPQTNRLPLHVRTLTYTGTLAEGSEVTIAWSMNSTAQGELIVPVPNGEIWYDFTLPPEMIASPETSPTPTLSLTVIWLTASRDRLTQQFNLPIRRSAWSATLSLAPDAASVIPGYAVTSSLVISIPKPTSVSAKALPQIQIGLWEAPQGQEISSLADFVQSHPAIMDATVSVRVLADSTSSIGIIAIGSFTPPDMGHFLTIARFTDEQGNAEFLSVSFGKTEAEWKASPLMSLNHAQPSLDKATYTVGTDAKIRWFCPFSTASRALALWGNLGASSRQRKLFTLTPSSENTLTIPVGQECRGGCSVTLLIVAPTQPDTLTLPVAIPTSQLLDLRLPLTLTFSVSIVVPLESESLDVTISLTQPIVAPDTETTLSIQVSQAGSTPLSSAEVALWVVDKAVLDLMPQPTVPELSVQQPFSFPDRTALTSSNYASMTTADVLQRARAAIKHRIELDPWITTGLFAPYPSNQYGATLDFEDELYVRCQYSTVTAFPYRRGTGPSGDICPSLWHWPIYDKDGDWTDGLSPGGATEDEMTGGSSQGAESEEESPGSAVPAIPADLLRSKFVTTPLFVGTLMVDSKGFVTVPFKVPSNVGTWAIKAVVVSSDYIYGTAYSELISKRGAVSLQPSLPRITRVGDRFQAGVTVTSTFAGRFLIGASMKSEPLTLPKVLKSVTLTTVAPLSFKAGANTSAKTVKVSKNRPLEVVFGLCCNAIGRSEVTFSVSWAGNRSVVDAFANELDSLGLQEPVSVATSFALAASPAETAEWAEGLSFPDALPGSGTVAITAGVGRFPAVQSLVAFITSDVQQSIDSVGYAYADGLVASMFVLPALDTYGVALAQSTIDLLKLVMAAMVENTMPTYGLQYLPKQIRIYDYPSLDLNAYALWMLRVVHRAQAHGLELPTRLDLADFTPISPFWESAVAFALNQQFQWWDQAGRVYDPTWWSELAFARLALGRDWVFPSTYGWEQSQWFSFEKLMENIGSLAAREVAMVLITMTWDGTQASDGTIIKSLCRKLFKRLRVQGRTAYVAQGWGGSRNAADIETNALVLYALLATTVYRRNPLLEKLANYVAQGERITSTRNTKCCWQPVSLRTASFRLLALSYYDEVRRSARPNLNVTVQSATNITLLQAKFTSAKRLPVSVTTPWAALGSETKPQPLDFLAIGTGEASVSLGLEFTPAKVFRSAQYRGIYVQKLILVHPPSAPSNSEEWIPYNGTWALTPGQVARVVIQITTPDDLSEVMVRDPLPSCLEAIDPNLQQSTQAATLKRCLETGFLSGKANSGRTMRKKTRKTLSASGGSRSVGAVDAFTTRMGCFPDSPEAWSFPMKQYRKDQVECFAYGLPAGSHTCSFDSVVVTSGTFTMPPTLAYVTAQPEVMGLSNTQPILVKQRK